MSECRKLDFVCVNINNKRYELDCSKVTNLIRLQLFAKVFIYHNLWNQKHAHTHRHKRTKTYGHTENIKSKESEYCIPFVSAGIDIGCVHLIFCLLNADIRKTSK